MKLSNTVPIAAPHLAKKLTEMDTSELHRARQENAQFATIVGRMAASARGRQNAAQSELDKRLADSRPKPSDRENTQISDHALLRYLQRKYNVDLQAVEQEMLTNIAAGESYLDGALVMHEGLSYIRNKGMVKTVMPNDYMDDYQMRRISESCDE
jgi:hypothetical protein